MNYFQIWLRKSYWNNHTLFEEAEVFVSGGVNSNKGSIVIIVWSIFQVILIKITLADVIRLGNSLHCRLEDKCAADFGNYILVSWTLLVLFVVWHWINSLNSFWNWQFLFYLFREWFNWTVSRIYIFYVTIDFTASS